MTKKVYRTAMGRTVDLGALQLQNENVRAVGNMGVNARGDQLNSQNQSIESRNVRVNRQYKKQSNVSDDPIVSSKTAVAKPKAKQEPAPVEEPKIESPAQETQAPTTGLADAIAKARQIKQEPMKTPRQLAQERAGVNKI